MKRIYLGFEEERNVAAFGGPDYFTAYYTCIANSKRVFVWLKVSGRFCVLTGLDPHYGAGDEELTDYFRKVWTDRPFANPILGHEIESDLLLLQAFIHEVTSKGNYDADAKV